MLDFAEKRTRTLTEFFCGLCWFHRADSRSLFIITSKFYRGFDMEANDLIEEYLYALKDTVIRDNKHDRSSSFLYSITNAEEEGYITLIGYHFTVAGYLMIIKSNTDLLTQRDNKYHPDQLYLLEDPEKFHTYIGAKFNYALLCKVEFDDSGNHSIAKLLTTSSSL